MSIDGTTSLTRRLLLALVAPLSAVALLLGLGGALTIDNIVERVNDRLLAASARAIAETLALEEDELTLDLPPFALGMLENESRDNVYYSVRHGGELVTGYQDLPAVPRVKASGEPAYIYSTYREMPIRIAAIARRVPRLHVPVVVQVAETLDGRQVLKRRMLIALTLLEVLLLALVVLLLPVAVRIGLSPLNELRRHMERREPNDFAPLPIRHVPHELSSLIAAFNSLLSRLEQAVEGMRRFTADASHQMRTPLSILRAHLSVLRSSGAGSEAGQASIRDIEAATVRLQRLLSQLLALARAESASGPELAVLKRTDIVALTRRVAMEYAPSAVKADVDLVFEESPAKLMVSTSPDLAMELLANILDNAIRYNKPGGEVIIAVRRTASGAIVSIQDEGPGIREEDRAAVFTRFRRLDRDQSRPGSGLGLAIVKTLADGIGANIQLMDRPTGKGLRVEIGFPAPARA